MCECDCSRHYAEICAPVLNILYDIFFSELLLLILLTFDTI